VDYKAAAVVAVEVFKPMARCLRLVKVGSVAGLTY
jgi:hypothetical protein